MQTTYYIFRHGETFASKAKTGYGWRIFSADLLPEAIPALERMGTYLQSVPTDLNVSSQIKRCRQTVGIIHEITGKEFVYDRRLNEYFIETFWQFKRRVKSLVQEIEQKKYKAVCICTHDALIATLLYYLSKSHASKPWNIFYSTLPGVLTIIENGEVRQVNFNKLYEV